MTQRESGLRAFLLDSPRDFRTLIVFKIKLIRKNAILVSVLEGSLIVRLWGYHETRQPSIKDCYDILTVIRANKLNFVLNPKTLQYQHVEFDDGCCSKTTGKTATANQKPAKFPSIIDEMHGDANVVALSFAGPCINVQKDSDGFAEQSQSIGTDFS